MSVHPTLPLARALLVPSALLLALQLLAQAPLLAQPTRSPFPAPISAADPIVVGVRDFGSLPDVAGEAPRMMLLVDEPRTERLFVNGMRGPIWSVSYEGDAVTEYVDIHDPAWGVDVESGGRERGFQSFAFHPDFGRPGTDGYGRFYTWTDVAPASDSVADFLPEGDQRAHHTVLLEWRARDAAAATYDGGPPRELMRFAQPFGNHNGGHLAFDPLADPDDPTRGLLYVGSADGGSGGDPMDLAQDPSSAFGKILRIDPLGTDSRNGEYGIPASNPWAADDDPESLGEVFAYGVRNPQRFGWDPDTGRMFVADIGQNVVEEVSVVTPGADLGWNDWEGSFAFVSREGVDASSPRRDPGVTYPVVEYAHGDPLLLGRSAVTGVHVYRDGPVEALEGLVLFGDFPSGEIFAFDADDLPDGGNQGFRRVLLREGNGEPTTFLALVQGRNTAQGREPSGRADLRFGAGPDGRVFLLNKHDGTIREIVPGG